jgi:hypothetical protein
VKFVAEILEILLLVALKLVRSGIELLTAATAEGLPDEAQIAKVDEPEPQAEAGDLTELAELAEQAEQLGSDDHQTVLPGECGAGELVQPLSTALEARGNHPAADEADNLDLHDSFDSVPAAVLEMPDLARAG